MNTSYYIIAVHYHNFDNNTYIEEVKTYDGSTKLRFNVVADIEYGKQIKTAVKNNSDGKYYEGEVVNIVNINGIKYIRTDRNNIAGDNLSNLPHY